MLESNNIHPCSQFKNGVRSTIIHNQSWQMFFSISSTYANGLKAVIQNQLLPTSGTVIVRTRATLPKLIQVQKVNNAACPRLGTIIPSNLQYAKVESTSIERKAVIIIVGLSNQLSFPYWGRTLSEVKAWHIYLDERTPLCLLEKALWIRSIHWIFWEKGPPTGKQNMIGENSNSVTLYEDDQITAVMMYSFQNIVGTSLGKRKKSYSAPQM